MTNKMIMRRIYMAVCLVLASASVMAQDLTDVLLSVERNNKELQALQKSNESQLVEYRSGNILEDPTIEYSPLFAPGTKGVASSELVVKLGFDFPTLYASRNKAGKMQQTVLDMQYQLRRRDILLEVKKICLDLIRLNQERALLDERMRNADELLVLFERRLAEGDASLLDVNKIRMDRMNVNTEVVQNETERAGLMQSLTALNGNEPLAFDAAAYPAVPEIAYSDSLCDTLANADFAVRAARASAEQAVQEVSVNRQNWIPKLEVGYRRNTDMDDAVNGFLIGGSVPIFTSANKVKSAKAKAVGANLEVENVQMQTEAQVRSLLNTAVQLRRTADTYDTELMYSTLRLLRTAVENGELSIIEYYVEADNIYKNLQAYMTVENQYQQTVAEIYKNVMLY